jgi:subtilisin family serine protease
MLAGLSAAPGAAAATAARSQEQTWHGRQVNLYAAQATGRYGSGVLVAVIDGWVDGSHPDFTGRVLTGADCSTGTCKPGQTSDSCTHGTHVAGTVASTSYGVATKARVLPVRVLTVDSNGDCTGTPAAVAAGIRYAVAQGAKVLNLSLGPDVPGLGSNSAIPTAVQEAADAGDVVVFSAGNADLPVAQAYGNNALVVAATGPDGQLASYSQHGQGVSVAAPGGQPNSSDVCDQSDCVLSLYPKGQYAVAAGTSMAAPHVSGLAALLFGQDPSRSREDVMNRITGTARPLSGAGAGLIDMKAALGVKTSTPTPTATRSTAPTPTRTRVPSVQPRATRAPSAVPERPVGTTAPAVPSTGPTTPAPTATTQTPAPVAEVPLPSGGGREDDEIPLPLTLVAAALVAAAGAGVITLSLKDRA